MKAQSLRKTVWLTNGLLAVGLVGGGAWYVTQVRPAAASPSSEDGWIKKAWEAYQVDRETIKPLNPWPVSLDELKAHITRPDLMSKESRIGVWPYVGPVPPAPREEAKAGPAADLPTGLAAIGAPTLILLQPPPDKSLMKFLFGSKKAGFFVPGDFIKEKDAKGRFKLVDIQRPDPDVARFKVIYDVYDDETKPPVKTGEVAEFTLIKPEDNKSGLHIQEAPAAAAPTVPGPAGGPGTGPAAGPVVASGAVPPRETWKPVVRVTGDSSRDVELDQATADAFRGSDADALVSDVKTEEVKNGIRISGIGSNSVAAKFDIRAGDILKSINGRPVHSRAQALEVAKSIPKDTASVQVVIERNGRDIAYNVDPRDPATRAAAGKVRYDNKPGGK